MIWLAFAVLTGVALLVVVWPLVRTPRTVARKDADVAFYEAQIAEIGRDVERGLIGAEDATTAKAEAARRLIVVGASEAESSKPPRGRGVADNEAGALRRAIAAGLAIVFVPAVAFGVYRIVGNPELPDEPLAARLAAVPGHTEIAAAVAKLEAHLARHPNDGRAWEVIAPVYLNLGRARDAVNAYANVLRLLGPTPERREAYGGALVFAANGTVTPQARKIFKAALAQDPNLPQARFFLGLAAEQDGDKATAIRTWTKLLTKAPPGARWARFVRQKIIADGGKLPPSLRPAASPVTNAAAAPEGRVKSPPAAAAAAVAALPSNQQQKFIHAMVDRLAQRLHQDGHDVEGWLRLVRAYTVLHEADKARAALADARKNFGSDSAALARLDQLARELGLEG